MGREAIGISKSFTWVEEAHSKQLDKVLDAFTKYYKPKTIETYERFQFLRRKQKVGEPFGSFHTDLLRLVETCNYHSIEKNKILRDQIVMNITFDIVREEPRGERADFGQSRRHLQVHGGDSPVSTMSSSVSAKDCDAIPEAAAYGVSKTGEPKTGTQQQQMKPCNYCCKRGACPAWGQTCEYCHKQNHLKIVCRKLQNTQREDSNAKNAAANAVASSIPVRATADHTNEDMESVRDHFAFCIKEKHQTDSDTWDVILNITVMEKD